MGNQNSARLIALEKSVKETSLSAGPSPKKFSTNTKDGIANGKQLEPLQRPRRYSDSTKSSRSRSPSPLVQKPSRFTIKKIDPSSIPSPKVPHKRQASPGDANVKLRTPRMAFQKFRADFNLSVMNLSGRRSRIQSGVHEVPFSFKNSEREVDNTPSIPTEEIFRPKNPTSPTYMASYRARASTISNGQVARLKTLMEGEGGSEDSFRKGGTRSRVAKGSRQSRKKKIPTVFRYYLGKNRTGKIDKVFIAGTMTNWRAVEMVKPKGDLDFVLIIDCYEGDHYFKFNVDGVWMNDDYQEKVTGRGNVEANLIRVKKSDAEVLEALACDSFTVKSSKTEGIVAQKDWGQVKLKWDTISKPQGPNSTNRSKPVFNPPLLPPQLLTNFLNKESEGYADPNLFPEPPTHVILNHLYAQSAKDNVLVLATTTRFRKKYATVVFYKPVD